jgi:hypothetical protein
VSPTDLAAHLRRQNPTVGNRGVLDGVSEGRHGTYAHTLSGGSLSADPLTPRLSLGVRWMEPMLQGTNAVIVHPKALGEFRIAAQATKVLGLR